MKIVRMRSCRRRALGALTVGVGTVALWAPAAHASPLSSTAKCPATSTSQAFSQWGDANEYALAPDGNFASASGGWTLSGGARIISMEIPLTPGDVASVGALYLPPGSSAASPPMCVDPSDPTYRFVGVSTGGPRELSSQAVYTTALGLHVPLSLNALELPSSWGPVAAQYTGAAPASILSDGTAQMSLHFQSSGDSLIDDVFVDPRMHGV